MAMRQALGYRGAMRYVIVDLEATCWMRHADTQHIEII